MNSTETAKVLVLKWYHQYSIEIEISKGTLEIIAKNKNCFKYEIYNF